MILKHHTLCFLQNLKFLKKATSFVKYTNTLPCLSGCSCNRIATLGFMSTHNIRHFTTTNSLFLIDRTHTCGELRSTNVGQKVRISGWLQFQRGGLFITLRDAYGNIQCIIPKVNFYNFIYYE